MPKGSLRQSRPILQPQEKQKQQGPIGSSSPKWQSNGTSFLADTAAGKLQTLPGSSTRQSPEDTADKAQAILATHRPSSPSSRARPSALYSPSNERTLQAASSPAAAFQHADEVLQHFARNGLDALPKLFICLPTAAAANAVCQSATAVKQGSTDSSSNSTWEPAWYDLQVVPKSQVAGMYCTMSATGVVQVLGNGVPSTHTSLGRWVRDAFMFKLFRGLTAFKQLWMGHSFNRWCSNTRQARYQRHKQQVEEQLLHLRPHYLKTLMDCRAKLAAIQSAGTLVVPPPGPYKLDALIDMQQEHRASIIAPLLSRTAAGIVLEVEQLASRMQRAYQGLAHDMQEHLKDPSAGAARGISPVKVQAEHHAMSVRHSAALHDLQRLPAFLRLLGLQVMQSYLDLLVDAVGRLKAHAEAASNGLVVDLLLAGGGVTLSPTMEEVLKGFSQGIIEHLAGVLKAAPRILKHPSMKALLGDPITSTSLIASFIAKGSRIDSSSGGSMLSEWQPAVHYGGHGSGGGSFPDLPAARRGASGCWDGKDAAPWLAGRQEEGGQLLLMMVGDRSLGTLRRHIDQQVMRSYREASVVTDTLSDLNLLLHFAHVWDANSYKAKQHTVAELRRDTMLLREWQAQLQVAIDNQPVGLLQLQTTVLKTTYMQRLASAQATISMLLVSAARREGQVVLAQLHSITK
eukprot:GHRR01024718.1.p1 GENE.GHRR01024718.1~~GHRR01024718.1.p1  ORF type:complete len:686 (+),score=249.45 GHRR01024718.1:347-2404(+)